MYKSEREIGDNILSVLIANHMTELLFTAGIAIESLKDNINTQLLSMTSKQALYNILGGADSSKAYTQKPQINLSK